MLIAGRNVSPDGIVGGPGTAQQAQDLTVALDDLAALAKAVGATLEETGTGTTPVTDDIALGSPPDQVAQDLVAMAQTAHAVYRESVTYILDSLASYRDALEQAARQYARVEEDVEDGLDRFNQRVDQVASDTTAQEQQAAEQGPADVDAAPAAPAVDPRGGATAQPDGADPPGVTYDGTTSAG